MPAMLAMKSACCKKKLFAWRIPSLISYRRRARRKESSRLNSIDGYMLDMSFAFAESGNRWLSIASLIGRQVIAHGD
jgi:hypothetical protein